MPPLSALRENFSLMVVEVTKQVEETHRALNDWDSGLGESIRNRDDYIDRMKDFISRNVFRKLAESRNFDKSVVKILKAGLVIVNNLENIADFCTNIVRQVRHLDDAGFLKQFDFDPHFEHIHKALATVEGTLFAQDLDTALEICKCEFSLDELYKKDFHGILQQLQAPATDSAPDDAQRLVTALLIFRYLERMGDSLLNIGEAIIESVVGEKLKIHQYLALRSSFDEAHPDDPPPDLSDPGTLFETIGETRSGCRIGRVRQATAGNRSRWAIFKDGSLGKLTREKENIEKWECLCPGLPPKLLGFQAKTKYASLLLEYLGGVNFQEIILEPDANLLAEGMNHLKNLLEVLWEMTWLEEPANARFMRQLLDRLPSVYKLHPEFDTPAARIDSLELPATNQLIEELRVIERDLPAPCSVFVHGDFNIDNILYDAIRQQVNFIDLNRSRQTDYIQDIAVFLVSSFRLPLFEAHHRLRLNFVSDSLYDFSKSFAHHHHDETFDARLALGLIRSFVTSTRFVVHPHFAREMFLRARYLMETMLEHHRPWNEFVLPRAILLY